MAKILYKLIYILFMISFIFLGIEIFNLGIIPSKYLIPGTLGLVFVVIIISLGFIFIKKRGLKIFLSIIEVFCIILSTIGIIYLHTTNNFFNNIKNTTTETNIYYLIVEKNSKYNKIVDLDEKTIGIYQNNNKATKNLKKEIDFKTKKINTITDVIDQISKIDSIFLNSAYYDLICDDNDSFEDNTKVIGKIKITNKSSLKDKNVDITKEPYSILISGIDTEGPITTTSRSDVNIVMTINPKTHKILLNHIPRDYYVRLHGTTGLKDKLTHSGIYGIDMSVQTIEDLLNTDINYYVKVNFNTLVNVVDAIGGIDVYSDTAFSEYGYSFRKGMNHLNGKEALMFSRIRHVLPGGDRNRGEHQEAVITAILEKVTTNQTLLSNYNELLNTLSSSFETNLSSKNIKKFLKQQINNPSSYSVETYNLDGKGTMGPTYTPVNRENNIYIMIPDQKTIDTAKQKIRNYLK